MRILSGIQPSGTIHIGNYFGMIKKIAVILSIIFSFTFVWLLNVSCEKNNFTTSPDDKLIFSNISYEYQDEKANAWVRLGGWFQYI